MITLFTGVPGSGKTAYAINEMLKQSNSDNPRPIYVHGIPSLKIQHEPVKCTSLHCDVCHDLPDSVLRADDWHEWAPDGAVLFFDETQNIFRPRSHTVKVPDFVANLEVHRHRGLDFFLITQHPSLIDSNVRRLVSRHVHLAGNWLSRVQYEWGECVQDPRSTSTAVKSSYTIPKKVFPLYKSATIHTKLDRKIPFQVYLLAFLVPLFAVLAYSIYQSIDARAHPEQAKKDQSQGKLIQGETFTDMQPKQSYDFNPKIINHPESAPAYQSLVKVVTFPKLAGCIRSKDSCKCFTQQATEYTVTFDECTDLVKHSRFNPYKDLPQSSNPQPRTMTSTPPKSFTNTSPSQSILNSPPTESIIDNSYYGAES